MKMWRMSSLVVIIACLSLTYNIVYAFPGEANDLPVVCPFCDPNWTPFPNMVSGMVGYNLAKGDPLRTDSDPGMGNQIFAPTRYEDQTVYLDESITAYELSNCQRSLSSKSWTTVSGLSTSLETFSTSGTDLQLGYEADVTAGVEGLDLSSTIPPPFTKSWSNSETMKNAASSFSQDSGMISISSGVCIQYEMKLSSYSLPQFMPPFVVALGQLHDASSQSSTQQDAAFKKFIHEFGTHYMIHSQLGAFFAQKTTYSGKVRQDVNYDALQSCTAKRAARIFGITTGPDTSKCTDEAEEKVDSYSESDVNQITISKGSRPTDIQEWVTQDFTPTPLKYTFTPIVNIFQTSFIENRNIQNSAGQPVDSLKLRQWFMPLYDKYCEVAEIDCSMPSGCGYDDKCPVNTKCVGEGPTHECESEWSSWSCYECGSEPKEHRVRKCTGCTSPQEIRPAENVQACCNVKHKLNIQVTAFCDQDPDQDPDSFEPRGYLDISIGDRQENQNIRAWECFDGCSAPINTWWYSPTKSIDFYENFDFLTKSNTYLFKLQGNAGEVNAFSVYLPPAHPPYLGNFEGFQDDASKYGVDGIIDFNGDDYPHRKSQIKLKFYKS